MYPLLSRSVLTNLPLSSRSNLPLICTSATTTMASSSKAGSGRRSSSTTTGGRKTTTPYSVTSSNSAIAQQKRYYSIHPIQIPFLSNYPNEGNDESLNANWRFYMNEIRCEPDNLYIDDLLNAWRGNYSTLEYRHGFIQWLFPLQESGVNYHAQPLQKHEIEKMKSDPKVVNRFLQSYEMMLDFYGCEVADHETGRLIRVSRPGDYRARYQSLERSSHNYLRISRILKSLSEMGLEKYNAGLLLHILKEQSTNNRLNTPSLINSMDSYWTGCIRNDEEREWVLNMIAKVRTGKMKFTEEMYGRALENRRKTGKLSLDEDDTTVPIKNTEN